MEIEVGEFVRTYNGLIGKVNKIEEKGSGLRLAGEFSSDEIIQFNDGKFYERRARKKDITKHSKNLIDLIKEGDYVNGYKTIELKKSNIKDDGICILVYRNHQYEQWETIFENEIKTILTHEQYEKNCYRLEEE